MKSTNVEEFLKNSLPSASKQEAESAGGRVLERLQSKSGGISNRTVMDFNPTRRTVGWWVPAMTAAAVIAIAVLVPTRIAQSAPAVLEDAGGSRRIQYGEIVRPSGDASAILAMADGSRVEMRSESELSLERADDGGVRILLNKGGVIVDAAAQHNGSLYVQTKEMMASVIGAVSLVKAEEEGSRVAAIGGEVRVQQGAIEKKLGPGERVATNPEREWLPMKEELAWSRQAVAHVAMLGQATRIPTSRLPAPQPQPKEEVSSFELATIRPAAPRPAPAGNARGGGGGEGRTLCSPVGVQLDPRRLSFGEISLYELVAWAYGRCGDLAGASGTGNRMARLSGGPEWVNTQRWDIEALIPESPDPLPTGFLGPMGEFLNGRSPKVQKMLRTLLEERFKVVVRREMKEMPVYLLTVAPGGTKFQGNVAPANMPRGAVFGFIGADGKLATPAEGAESSRINGAARCNGNPCGVAAYSNTYMSTPVGDLSSFVGRLILDRTGIQEKVSFSIEWPRPDAAPVRGQLPRGPGFQEVSKALEAIGLQLKEDPKGMVEIFVIERADMPSEN